MSGSGPRRSPYGQLLNGLVEHISGYVRDLYPSVCSALRQRSGDVVESSSVGRTRFLAGVLLAVDMPLLQVGFPVRSASSSSVGKPSPPSVKRRRNLRGAASMHRELIFFPLRSRPHPRYLLISAGRKRADLARGGWHVKAELIDRAKEKVVTYTGGAARLSSGASLSVQEELRLAKPAKGNR